jgi:PPOX class probable F420-dependent enzyme
MYLKLKLPEEVITLVEGKNFAHIATLMPDGSPQVTPVWIDREGDLLLVNTVEGRQKARNFSRDPRVAVSIADQQNPYFSTFIRGRVIGVTSEGAAAHIDKQAKKYMGVDKYPGPAGEKRVIVKIEPLRIKVLGRPR